MKRTLYFFMLFFSVYQIRPEISFTEIKGLYNSLLEDKKHLSSVHGYTWWKTGVVENMYRYGNQDDAMIKMVQEIFYLQRDQVTFDVTTLSRKPAKYFTPKIIGQILQFFEMNQAAISISTQTEYAQQLSALIKQAMQFDQLKAESLKVVAPLYQKLKTFPDKKQLKAEKALLIKKESRIRARKDPGIKTGEQRARSLAEIKKRVEEIDQLVSEIEVLERVIHNKSLSEKSVDTLASLIVGSVVEMQQGKYVPYALQQILLAFAWQKANTKEELLAYFEAFNPTVLSVDVQSLVALSYTQADHDQFKEQVVQNPALLLEKYEIASFSAYAAEAWDQLFPPIVSAIGDAEYEMDGKKYTFADCGETSLRNFFNIVLYNKEKSILDISYLEKAAQQHGLIVSPALIEYYKKYHMVSKVSTKPYYDAWTQVVSGLPGVNYLNHESYEINSGIDNLLKVFNHLLFGNSAEFASKSNEKKIDMIVQALSREGFSLEWGEKEDDNNIVNTKNKGLTLIFEINAEYEFSWEIMDSHFTISSIELLGQQADDEQQEFHDEEDNFDWGFDDASESSSQSGSESGLDEEEEGQARDVASTSDLRFSVPPYSFLTYLALPFQTNTNAQNMTAWYLHIMGLNPNAKFLKQYQQSFMQMPSVFFNFIGFLLPLYNIDIRMGYIGALLMQERAGKSGYSALISKLLLTIPADYYYIEIIMKALRRDSKYDEVINHWLKKEAYKEPVVAAIIQTDLKRYYSYIRENINNVSNEVLETILTQILRLQREVLYDLVTNARIIKSQGISYIYQTILENSLERFYPLITKENVEQAASNCVLDTAHEGHHECSYALNDFLSLILEKQLVDFYSMITPLIVNKLENPSSVYCEILSKKLEQLYPVITDEGMEKIAGRSVEPIYSNVNLSSLDMVLSVILNNKLSQFYKYITPNAIANLEDPGLVYAAILSNKLEQFYPLITDEGMAKIKGSGYSFPSSLAIVLSDILNSKLSQFYKYITPNAIANLQDPGLVYESILSNKLEQLYPLITDEGMAKLYGYWLQGVLEIILKNKLSQFYKYVTPNAVANLQDPGSIYYAILSNTLEQLYPVITDEEMAKVQGYWLQRALQEILQHKLSQFYKYITPESLEKIDDLGAVYGYIFSNGLEGYYPLITDEGIKKAQNGINWGFLVYNMINNKLSQFYHYITPASIDVLEGRYAIYKLIVKAQIKQLYPIITQAGINKLSVDNLYYLMNSVSRNKINELYPVFITDKNIARLTSQQQAEFKRIETRQPRTVPTPSRQTPKQQTWWEYFFG